MIHDKSDKPNAKLGGVLMQPGTYTKIAFTKNEYTRVSTNSIRCRDDDPSELTTDSIVYLITKRIASYSDSICREIFIQINFIIIKNCRCAGN